MTSSNRKHKTYTKQFTEETVALVTEQGYTVIEAAEACSGLIEPDSLMRDNTV